MSLQVRLKRLEVRVVAAKHDRPAQRSSVQWLTLLEWFAQGFDEVVGEVSGETIGKMQVCAAAMHEAAALLRGYVASGRQGATVEDHCLGALSIFAAWKQGWHDPQHPWHGAPFPFVGDSAFSNRAEHLRRCLQIDRWCAAGALANK